SFTLGPSSYRDTFHTTRYVSSMEVERPERVLRARPNKQAPAKQVTPVAVKKFVSVAAIFKEQPQRIHKPSATPKVAHRVSTVTLELTPGQKEQTRKSVASSRSPAKTERKVARKMSDVHPLVIAFKDSSDDYRHHLYQTTSFKINKTLEELVHSLHEKALQPISLSANVNQVSPIRLPVVEQLEREAQKIYQPISAYQLRLNRTNTDGEREQFMAPLEQRMADYAAYIEKQKAEIDKLKKHWEIIVGEIWKLGVQVLGEEALDELLFTKQPDASDSPSPSQPTEVESTLFVNEYSTPLPARHARSKKRVTFEPLETGNQLPHKSSQHLAFLYGLSLLRVKPVNPSPILPAQGIEDLEERVNELGEKELEEYRKAEKEYHQFWRKKMTQLTNVWGQDY
ncbi:hypothetical protein EK21DRAFT_54407, partial [Setomelanomma holmii]